MNLFEIHLEEVKDSLVRKRIINSRNEIISSFGTIENETKLSLSVVDVKDIVAGYYISDNIFYYLRKDKTNLFLHKYFFTRNKYILVDDECFENIERLDFIKFKTYCIKMDYGKKVFFEEDKKNV